MCHKPPRQLHTKGRSSLIPFDLDECLRKREKALRFARMSPYPWEQDEFDAWCKDKASLWYDSPWGSG